METFVQTKALVYNPGFQAQKDAILSGLDAVSIEPPLAGLIAGINKLACCFTLQCCFGHFVHKSNRDPFNTEALPEAADIRRVDYKIAYLALCLDEGPTGREFYGQLEGMTAVDPDDIQFGSALWFWGKAGQFVCLAGGTRAFQNTGPGKAGVSGGAERGKSAQ